MGAKPSKHKRETNQMKTRPLLHDQNAMTSSDSYRLSNSAKRERFLKQVKRDLTSQRVSKSQLHRLSFDLSRTPWYLGRRLGFSEKEVRKILLKHKTKQDAIFNILITWRKRNGFKATVQNLVIILELAGYEFEEYKSILKQQESGQAEIYSKVPEIKAEIKSNGYFRYDSCAIDEKRRERKEKEREKQEKEKKDKSKKSSPRRSKDLRSHQKVVEDINKNYEDIAEFARRGWKRPHKKALDYNHIADFQHPLHNTKSKEASANTSIPANGKISVRKKREVSNTDVEGDSGVSSIKREVQSKGLHIRRCSDSTLNYSSMSPVLIDSETELREIFQGRDRIVAEPLQGADAVPANDVISTSPQGASASEALCSHLKDSPIAKLEAFRKLSFKVNQQYSDYNRNRHPEKTRIGGNSDISSSYHSFFKFDVRASFPCQHRGQISGLDLSRDDDIILSDSSNKRIVMFDKFGNFRTAFDTQSDLSPKGIFVTPENEIIACCGSEVRVFSAVGKLRMSFGQGTFRNNSYCVVCDAVGNYYVTDIVGHTVSVYDSKGNIRKRFGYQGSKLMNFNQPVALAISSYNELLISDGQNHSIKVYSMAGRPLQAIGSKGRDDGNFWNPFGLCFDKNGFLYVADCGNNRISAFDKNYNFLHHVLTEEDGLRMPCFIKINSRGQLIVSEWKNEEVKVFSLETTV